MSRLLPNLLGKTPDEQGVEMRRVINHIYDLMEQRAAEVKKPSGRSQTTQTRDGGTIGAPPVEGQRDAQLEQLGMGTVTSITITVSGNLSGGGTISTNGELMITLSDNPSFTSVDVANFYKVAGTRVVGAQEPAITPPAGGATIDAESRTTIGTIITTLQNHGLTA